MEILNYFLVSLIAYLGSVAGYIMILFAPEEKKPGMKYFNAINYFLVLLFVLFLIFFNWFNLLVVLGVFLFFVMLYFFRKYGIYLMYLLFSVVFPFLDSQKEVLVFSILIFVYGLVVGAVLIDLKNKKVSLMKVLSLIYFVIISNIFNLIL